MLKRFRKDKELKMFRTLISKEVLASESDKPDLVVLLFLIRCFDEGNLDNAFRVQHLSNGDMVIRSISTEKDYNKLAKTYLKDKKTKHLAVWNYQIA